MNINDLLFYRQQMQPQMPGGAGSITLLHQHQRAQAEHLGAALASGLRLIKLVERSRILPFGEIGRGKLQP